MTHLELGHDLDQFDHVNHLKLGHDLDQLDS
jgi:hypothetical protein